MFPFITHIYYSFYFILFCFFFFFFFFFFNDTATTEIHTLSLHDALPIYGSKSERDEGTAADADHDDGRYDQKQETAEERDGAANIEKHGQ